MTCQEFSDLFDVLYNNIMSNQAPGLDAYEKSVFLTKALDEIVKSYFSPKLNKPQEGFDGSERRLIDFSMLITVAKPTLGNALFDTHTNSASAVLPSDILMIVNEQLKVSRNGSTITLLVIPLNYMEYTRLMSKPYKRPLQYQAWRISNSGGNGNIADLVIGPNDTKPTGSGSYIVRYVKRPSPIIIDTLEGVTIGASLPTYSFLVAGSYDSTVNKYYDLVGGVYVENPEITSSNFALSTRYKKVASMSATGSAKTECILDPILHLEILQRAVELAKAAYTGDLLSQIALGQASETNMGAVASQR